MNKEIEVCIIDGGISTIDVNVNLVTQVCYNPDSIFYNGMGKHVPTLESLDLIRKEDKYIIKESK